MSKKITQLEDLQPDKRNANKGTARGRGMVEGSLRKYGAGRSILADRNGQVIAGNKTLDAAAEIGLSIRVIETNGNELVVVQRTDLDLDVDASARELAIADNRSAQAGLEWDADILAALAQEVDLSQFWHEDELAAVLAASVVPEPGEQKEPELQSECFIEIYCSRSQLDSFRPIFDEWSGQHGCTINIS